MASALDAIRAKLMKLENTGSESKGSKDESIYPFWNMAEGKSSLLRFLPDGNNNNTFFWVERQMISLEFPGVKGQDENKRITLRVPCGEMYGDPCPVLTETRPWWNDPSLTDMARKYWKKRTYVFQGFVVEDGMESEEKPANPIRKFMIGPQIFNIIKAALMDPDMENIPIDYVNGTDFRLAKTNKGQYADYSTSKWARRERALSEEELAAIDQYGLPDLNDALPPRPTPEHYAAIKEMFEASVNGELYDPERWAQFYRPYGVEMPSGPKLQETTESVAAPAKPQMPKNTVVKEASLEDDDNDDIPWEEPATEVNVQTVKETPAKKAPEDILAMIRNRSTAS